MNMNKMRLKINKRDILFRYVFFFKNVKFIRIKKSFCMWQFFNDLIQVETLNVDEWTLAENTIITTQKKLGLFKIQSTIITKHKKKKHFVLYSHYTQKMEDILCCQWSKEEKSSIETLIISVPDCSVDVKNIINPRHNIISQTF